MKTALVIIFYDLEDHINKPLFLEIAKELRNTELCLVNNNSTDHTYYLLKDIKEDCKNVSVINIKRKKSEANAVKAGARFMINEFDINSIGYINANAIGGNFLTLDVLLRALRDHQDLLKEDQTYILKPYEKKHALMHKLYAITDRINELDPEMAIGGLVYNDNL
ncbi:glycosyltransferase [Sediminibacter sp. Hel_I_10]|uniref:glycosyltransferase n=1 Tax=Sediminibacter sp. Hel_I_10 TaxID=1392490 RepID=UPI00068DD053|nr:glycosyltransferase [Sediminibacter sp. Hel_I_10]